MAIVSQSELILQRREWKRNGKSVVCAAGAFDLLHPGHIRLLEQSRGLGDILVVALQSDASVRASGLPEPNRGEAREAAAARRAV
ncbi:MAG: adenylyltransferase/cytidyltransferase family protein, partial [Candidatus Acidiferrales bacterium]